MRFLYKKGSSLGKLVLCISISLPWKMVSTFAKEGPRQSLLGCERFHSPLFDTNGLSYLNKFFIFKVPKYFSSCLGISCQEWRSLHMKLKQNLISPFQMLPKFTSKKGMSCLTFPRYFYGFNGN